MGQSKNTGICRDPRSRLTLPTQPTAWPLAATCVKNGKNWVVSVSHFSQQKYYFI